MDIDQDGPDDQPGAVRIEALGLAHAIWEELAGYLLPATGYRLPARPRN